MKVLLVDDDALMLTAMAHFLKNCGLDIITAKDGVEAIGMSQQQKPDLIVADIMMPGISGLNLLSILRRVYFNPIPVILISSLDKAEVIMSSLGLGADDFLVKPIDFTKLYSRIKSYIKE